MRLDLNNVIIFKKTSDLLKRIVGHTISNTYINEEENKIYLELTGKDGSKDVLLFSATHCENCTPKIDVEYSFHEFVNGKVEEVTIGD